MTTSLYIILFFAIVGILDTLYLIYHKISGTDVACWFFPPEWCRKVQYSSYSKTFGIPNAVAGLVMYIVILLLLWLYVSEIIAWWPLASLITFGFLFSMYFVYVQAFILRAFCTWCVVSAINFSAMFLVVLFN
jgi:uncharacterized membrane protein